jgi:hypothetical protein
VCIHVCMFRMYVYVCMFRVFVCMCATELLSCMCVRLYVCIHVCKTRFLKGLGLDHGLCGSVILDNQYVNVNGSVHKH